MNKRMNKRQKEIYNRLKRDEITKSPVTQLDNFISTYGGSMVIDELGLEDWDNEFM